MYLIATLPFFLFPSNILLIEKTIDNKLEVNPYKGDDRDLYLY